MKLLFDENLSYRIVKKVSRIAPRSLHVSRTGLEVPAKDTDIWDYAKLNKYVVVSFDEDFQDLSSLYGFPPKVILLKLGNSSTQAISEVLFAKWEEIKLFYQPEAAGVLEIF
ncbi:DUF5615 family PIN-like protein [Dyadobacter aurulentus]|uniref:DUF5615 family PIN-like protein n=1 Tax=Dyadobacter sp. UC 10 TaxID=2605428 RepID=UPI0011F35C83|nr:DUF5615 family PIN-like protein [Dyadobacter sp. UC 10]KAA0989031.1 hypothetical protein FXO21_02050 [Dyadobacter sp. UC 10]